MKKYLLLLPVFLFSLLVAIDVSRLLWAQAAVQRATIEATRFAVSGQPYINPDNGIALQVKEAPGGVCTRPEGESHIIFINNERREASSPFLCNPVIRAEAIKNVARQVVERWINPLPCPQEVASQLEGYNSKWNCNNLADVFGVQVVGEAVETSPSLTEPFSGLHPVYVDIYQSHYSRHSSGLVEEKPLYIYQAALPNNAGEANLNVRIITFYNIPIFMPLFKMITGSSTLTIRRNIIMQNYGICPPHCDWWPSPITPIKIESDSNVLRIPEEWPVE